MDEKALYHLDQVGIRIVKERELLVLLFHNHPSQNVKPSREDIAVTDQLIQACALIGIPVTDHIIVGNAKEYYSFKNHGRLPMPNLQFADDESKLDFHDAGTESRKSVRKKLKENQRKGAAEGLNTENRKKRVNKEQVL